MTTNNTQIQDPATSKQKQLIHLNTPTKDMKEEWVQWATNSNHKTSCNDLTFDEANLILVQLGKQPHKRDNWGVFDVKNPKHRIILSEVISIGYTTVVKGKTVADMAGWFSNWLHTKAPVKKPLMQMEPKEVEKIIKALKGVFKHKWK